VLRITDLKAARAFVPLSHGYPAIEMQRKNQHEYAARMRLHRESQYGLAHRSCCSIHQGISVAWPIRTAPAPGITEIAANCMEKPVLFHALVTSFAHGPA